LDSEHDNDNVKCAVVRSIEKQVFPMLYLKLLMLCLKNHSNQVDGEFPNLV
jgi:hypothetical protein